LVQIVIDAASGLTAFFISKTGLVASKLAAGRMHDFAGVEDIREASGPEAELVRAISRGYAKDHTGSIFMAVPS